MLGLTLDRSRAVKLALGVDKPPGSLGLLVARSIKIGLHRIEQVTAGIALVTTSTLVMAQRALSLYITISQEGLVLGAVCLSGLALLNVAIVPQVLEDRLHDFSVLICGRATKGVKVDPEPVVDLLVNRVILGAKSRGIHTLRKRLCLCCGAVLVGTANVDGWQTSSPAEASKDVGRLDG